MPWPPTTGQLLDMDGVARRSDRFRFLLLDNQEEEIGELHPDRSRPPSVQNDVTASVPRQLRSLHLPDDEFGDVNTLTDRVKVLVELQNGAQFSLGVFLWGDDSKPRRSWQATERFSSLVDKSLMLNQQMLGSFGWGANAGGSGGLNLAIIFLVTQVFGTTDIFAHPLGDGADYAITEPVGWPPSTSWRRAIAELGAMAGLTPPWFDRDGLLNMPLPPDPDDVDPVVEFAYGSRIIADSILESDDLLDAPNVFGVYHSGTEATVIGRWELAPSAPHSAANRGFEVAMVESRQDLSNKAQANRAARSLATTAGVAYDWLEFQSTVDPRFDTWDPVAVQLEPGGEWGRWLSTAWQIECTSGGVMSHTMRRVHRGTS